MSKFPVMPLWVSDYEADTKELSQAEHGCYFLLMNAAWLTSDCSLPDDDTKLARIARCDRRTWNRQRVSVLERYWTRRSDGRWIQKRQTEERSKCINRAASARASAQHRWHDKPLKDNNTGHAIALRSEVRPQCSSSSYESNPPTPHEDRPHSPAEPAVPALPLVAESDALPQGEVIAVPEARQEPDVPQPLVPTRQAATPAATAKPGRSRRDQGSDPDFATWWGRYPKKVGKIAAEKCFAKARKAGASIDDLTTGLAPWLSYWGDSELRFVPDASRWLREERWRERPATGKVVRVVDFARPRPSVPPAPQTPRPDWDKLRREGRS